MAIRRISDLPSLGDGELSDCLIEVSYKDDKNNYSSRYTNIEKFGEYTTNYINNTTITNLCIDNGTVNIYNSDFNIYGPENTTNVYSKEINLCSINDLTLVSEEGEVIISGFKGVHIGGDDPTKDPPVTINGDPVVINKNLSVWHDKTESSQKVEFTNVNNIINAEFLNDYTSEQNKNRVVTCGMLNKSLGYATKLIYQITYGSGVDL